MGSKKFKDEMLDKLSEELRPSHAGEVKVESAEAKAERIIREELRRLRWGSADLKLRMKTDPVAALFRYQRR